MIKKLLTVLALTSFLPVSLTLAQCTPDPTITIPGVYPDSATGLPPGYVTFPYSEVVQVRIPVDTVYLGQTIPITNFSIDSIIGLPASFSYACNPGTCIFPGGSNGCILISGTPAATGTFNLTVYGTANGVIFGNPAALPFQLDYYKITVYQSGVGIPSNSAYSFTVMQNEPNPFSTFSNLNITSPVAGKAELKIFNLIGNEVYRETYRVNTGKNTIRLDARELDSGVYFYTLSMGEQKATRRMVISKK